MINLQAEHVTYRGLPALRLLEHDMMIEGESLAILPESDFFEYFFIRPSNGRTGDQLRRNHSTQYCSYPDYPWYRMREESPGPYESYNNLVKGEWTQIKIAVSGVRAQLFVNGADQPCL